MKTTLSQVLAARDARAALQRRLLDDYPGLTLVCATVVMPGEDKSNREAGIIATAMQQALAEKFGKKAKFAICNNLPTGFEQYLLLDLPQMETKTLTCQIEDSHPLGRLFDLDVIMTDGSPMSREEIGVNSRSCLICHSNARICMRERRHSSNEISDKINSLINDYLLRIRD